jgi:hypothetical protein
MWLSRSDKDVKANKRFSELVNVFACRDAMFRNHRVHYLARSEGVNFQGRVQRLEQHRVFYPRFCRGELWLAPALDARM